MVFMLFVTQGYKEKYKMPVQKDTLDRHRDHY